MVCSHNTVFILEFRVRPTTFDEGSHTVSSDCLKEIYTDDFSPPNDSWEWFTVRMPHSILSTARSDLRFQNRFGVMQLTGILVRVDGVRPASLLPPSPWTDVAIASLMPSSRDHLLATMQRCPLARRRGT